MSMDTLQTSTQNVSSGVEEAKYAADYAEALFESIKIINGSMMKDLHYDETIECTVTDDSNAAEGEYRVTNGSADFFAYSFEKYRVGENVYVTIPQGDYSKDKLIVGKVLKAENTKPFKYVSPLENFLDITGNLDLNASAEKTFSLLANDVANTEDGTEEGYLYEPVFARYGLNYGGFTRFAISADFCSLLSEYQCERGDYGLRCEVTIRDTEALISASKGAPTQYVKNFYLNTEDMIGNPYGFDGYFRQEKMFDISELGAIESIVVYFEQASSSFYDIDGRRIPCYRTFKEWNGENFVDEYTLDKLPDNLFVKNVNVALGFDMRDQEGEYVQLYSFNPMTYSTKVSDEVNKKVVHLRWLHEDETGQKLQMKSDYEDPFEIRWYRFRQGAPAADKYGGVNWEQITTNGIVVSEKNPITDTKAFEISFTPKKEAVNEQIKVVVLYGKEPGYYPYKLCPFQDEQNFKDTYHKGYFYATAWDSDNKPTQYAEIDKTKYEQLLTDEAWKTCTYYYKSEERSIYRSSPIVFTNEENIPDNATIVSLSALTLECYDLKDPNNIVLDTPTFGNYLLYNEQNDLIDRAQQNVARLIKWTLNITGFTSTRVSKVEWHYPEKNTMLNHISEMEIEQDFGHNQGLMYYIGNHYSSSKDDNTIVCTVTYDGVTYTATKELTFGQAGTMGASATFLLDFIDGQAVLTTELNNETQENPQVQAVLYDENNRLVDLKDYTITWSWFTSPSTRKTATDHITIDGSGSTVTLIPDEDLEPTDCYILQAKLSGWKNTASNSAYDLIAYLPIPIRRSSQYKYITGADRIVYLTDGTPNYYQGHYIMHKHSDGTMVKEVSGWAIVPHYSKNDKGELLTETKGHAPALKTSTSIEKSYEGESDTNQGQVQGGASGSGTSTDTGDNSVTVYKLSPAPFYFEDSTAAYAVTYSENGKVQWTQPIVILESRYFSSMVNDWDGKTLQLNDGEGTILASMIGAGKKTGDNQFSGVLLGDWSKNSTNGVVETGLYGFHNGKMSFGFKDDGTAFIGEKGRGQLVFDGNESTIASAAYRTKTGGGMEIDFDEPRIFMRQGVIDTVSVYTTTKSNVFEPYKMASILGQDSFEMLIANGTQLAIKTSETSYQYVDKWNSAWLEENKDQQLYQYFASKVVTYAPVAGINSKAKFIEQCKAYDLPTSNQRLALYNSSTNKYDVIKASDLPDDIEGQDAQPQFPYPASTIWAHPAVSESSNSTAVKSQTRTISIDATAAEAPIQVGDKFKLNWDGTLYAAEGSFTGEIHARTGTLQNLDVVGTLNVEKGQILGATITTKKLVANNGVIGGWTVSPSSVGWVNGQYAVIPARLSSGSMTLYSDGTIDGGTIKGSALIAKGGAMSLDGFIKVRVEDGSGTVNSKWAEGYFGYNESNIPMGEEATVYDYFGIGMSCQGSANTDYEAEIKTTIKNTGLKYGANYLSAEAGCIVINANASNSILHLKAKNKVAIEGGALEVTDDAVKANKTLTVASGDLKVSTGSLEVSSGTATVKNLKVTGTTEGVHAVFG